MSRGGSRGFGRGGMSCNSCRLRATNNFLTGRGGGRGGYQNRDAGPPDQVLGILHTPLNI